MSAAPLPKEPEAPADPSDAEGWALLESLKRRLDDQAVQGRKTQQQVTQLAESIGALVELQRRRTRGLNLNSFVAYLIFTLLCGAGFYFVYAARADELARSRDRAVTERDVAAKRADDATAKLAARDAADRGAWEVYELLAANKRADAMTKLDGLKDLPLSRTERTVLAARAHETQVMEVENALKSAVTSFKAGRHAEALPALEAALVSEPNGTRTAAIHYYLGVGSAKTGQLEKAVTHLTAALAREADHEDVRFQLASALDRSGQYAKARVEYDRFATAHPQSPLAVFAMRRSATLARLPHAPVAPPAGLVRPKPVPKPVPKAPTPTPPPTDAPADEPGAPPSP